MKELKSSNRRVRDNWTMVVVGGSHKQRAQQIYYDIRTYIRGRIKNKESYKVFVITDKIHEYETACISGTDETRCEVISPNGVVLSRFVNDKISFIGTNGLDSFLRNTHLKDCLLVLDLDFKLNVSRDDGKFILATSLLNRTHNLDVIYSAECYSYILPKIWQNTNFIKVFDSHSELTDKTYSSIYELVMLSTLYARKYDHYQKSHYLDSSEVITQKLPTCVFVDVEKYKMEAPNNKIFFEACWSLAINDLRLWEKGAVKTLGERLVRYAEYQK